MSRIDNAAPVDLEWSGKLAESAGQGATFALYLAMHCLPNRQPRQIVTGEKPVSADEDFPQRLNHYRRAPLSPQPDCFEKLNGTREALRQGNLADAALWLSMHPDPLSARNDASFISPEVKVNCSIHTQLRLRGQNPGPYAAEPENLADIIQGSASLLQGSRSA